jgi:tripeptidyl-peptidase-1
MLLFLFINTLLSTAFAPSEVVREDFEALNDVPLNWSIQLGRAVDLSSSLDLRLHLKQQNVAEFEQMVYEISTPGHQSYGAHMSPYSINSMLQPADETFSW